MRRGTLLTLPLAAVALAAAGCGASEISAEEVPGSPPALIVPVDSELGASGSGADASTDTTTDESADATTGADSGTTGTADTGTTVAPADPSGGTAAPEVAPEDTTTTEPAQPPAGSAPEQFESFCEQNAGAC